MIELKAARRANRVVGISDMVVSDCADDILITYSLGSCVGLTLYDPAVGVGGMLHAMLPLSRIDKDKAASNPYMFTDTGVAALIQAVLNAGASKQRLVAKVAGGAAPLNAGGMFQIGERNFTVLHKVLWKNNVLIGGQDVGGTVARTMTLYMDSGVTTVRVAKDETEI
ncbi:MAG: hypothetical protein AMXMBFR84_29010 [Candidatus Hydrogenedentota bacterium]